MELNPLAQIDPVVIGSTAAIFGATYFTLRKVYFLPYIETMERRRLAVARGEDDRAEAERLRALAREEADATTGRARSRADDVLHVARAAAEERRRELLEDAHQRAERRLAEGRAAIVAEREREIRRLREESVACVGMACEKLLGTYDSARVEAAIDRVIQKQAGLGGGPDA